MITLRHAEHVEKAQAERRLETRFLLAEPVKVTLLGEAEESCWGQTLNVSVTGVSLTTPRPVEIGSPVKLEVTDGMILGEVRHCQAAQGSIAEYLVGISIEHVLFGWMEFYERARAMDIVVDDPALVAPSEVDRR